MNNIVKNVKEITRWVDAILPPVEILKQCRKISENDKKLSRIIIDKSEKGIPIEAYSFAQGDKNILFYGFPDPGEAVGGTGVLALILALLNGNSFLNSLTNSLNLKWNFIPCLNFDDQPKKGCEIVKVMRDPAIREVDWCLNNPRPETKALIQHAEKNKPVFTFPLHDEFHSGESIPVYFPVSRLLPIKVCDAVRKGVTAFGFSINDSYNHPIMGQGFFEMKEAAPDYCNSTFSLLSSYSLVFACEISCIDQTTPADMVAAQLAAGLTVLNYVLKSLP